MSSLDPFVGENEIEDLVRAAGDYVQPSRDLRPRVVEGARLRDKDRRAEGKLAILVVAILVVCIVRHPFYHWLTDYRHQSCIPSATELHQQALQLESQPDVGTHWGMTEAFYRLRQYQAHRLGRTTVQ